VYHFLYKLKIPIIPKILMVINRLIFGAYIPESCTLGHKVRFSYGGSGVVIHARAVIGDNVKIGPSVTIGGRSKIYEVPKIGDNVYIAGGAKILGNVSIGNNVIIGANSIVLKDLPDNCIAVGIPVKIIRENINIKDYV
jgi:serine O-acetyltransferase